MVPPTSPFVVFGALSALAGVALALVVWHQRDARGARAYTALLVILATWSALYVGQLLGPTVAAKRPWLVARHAITPAIPVAFWVFATRYTDRAGLRSSAVLGGVVGVGAVLAPLPVLDPAGLYWADLSIAGTGAGALLDVAFGPLFWLVLAYICLVVGAGHALVVSMTLDSFAVYRRQLAAVALSGIVGFGLLAVFLTEHLPGVPNLNPFPNVQVLTYATVLVAVPLGWSYYRNALFGLQPLAHRTVVGNMDDAVFALDPEGVVRKANGPARRMVGEPDRAEPVGATFPAVFEDRPALLEAYRAAAGDGPADGADAVEVVVDGQRRYYDLAVSAIRASTGERSGTVIVVRDVTTRARQRERLERTNEQLERLADVVSHDLRAPLSTAEKLTTLLRQDLDDPDASVEASLADLEAVHDSLGEFADHLPKLARESTDVESPVTCDLASLAESAWAVVDTGNLDLEIAETRDLRGDRRRLQQVFENCFRNCVEHGSPTARPRAPGESPTVARRGEGGAADGGSPDGTSTLTTVRVGTFDGGVYVEDDGPGIPPHRREDVFEYGTTTGNGSGFGLAIVRTIVEAHGWAIEATESEDGGARFEIGTDG